MQIIRTDVAQTIVPSGHKVVRVRFCGETGDCVTVDMSVVEHADDAAAIERAKAILIQTASIDCAVNEYDARSNGNFDEVVATSASSGTGGGIYIFEYRDGDTSRQVPPCTMPTRSAAHAEAMRCAIDMLVDLQPGQDALSGWLVRVRGENGDLLFTVDVLDAEAAINGAATGQAVRLPRED